MQIDFLKMHGAGNDFAIFDAREQKLAFTEQQVIALSNRHTGIGSDQLIVIEPSKKADCFMRIYNPDGSQSGACGNATRCIAFLLMEETGKDAVSVETLSGVLTTKRAGKEQITVMMGKARTDWNEIPLARACDTLHLPIQHGALRDAVGVNMGNPHAVFFVRDVNSIDLATEGQALEHDPFFPERANIGVAEVISDKRLRLRVWERGAGETLACGSGACAAAVAANRRGLTGRNVAVELRGGVLQIVWNADGTVLMTGPVKRVFSGSVEIKA